MFLVIVNMHSDVKESGYDMVLTDSLLRTRITDYSDYYSAF